MKAPRVAGAALRALCAAVESPGLGALLQGQLLAGANIVALRQAPCDAPLPLTPLLPANPQTTAPPAALDVVAGPAARGGAWRHRGVADFAAAYRDKRMSPHDVALRVLEHTRALDAAKTPLRAIIQQDRDDVLKQALASSERHARGAPLSVLDGVPVAVKDELDQAGYGTTAGTKFLGKSHAASDATVVARLRALGAVLIGKANMHEIGIGVTGLNPHHGVARNPYNLAHHTGGSSSGPGAAVAAGLCPIAVGADGGGSIRIPASLCGVAGLKATRGRVSEHGAYPLCWSVGHVGPLAASVRDCAVGYAAMAGVDVLDEGTLRSGAVDVSDLEAGVRGVRVGVYRAWFGDAEPDVVAGCERALDALAKRGAVLVDIEIPELELMRVCHLVTIVSEMASSQEQLYARHKGDYAGDTRLNLALARVLTARDLLAAQRHRGRFQANMLELMSRVDVVVTPTTGCTAPPVRSDALATGESDIGLTGTIMRFASLANLTGLPAITVPVGVDKAGLPMGLQAMARPWQEAALLRLALSVEDAVPPMPRPQAWVDLLA